MATKKLSPNMVKVLLAAGADGWISKPGTNIGTIVALIDRKLIGAMTYQDIDLDEGLHFPGYWLTDAGKAKVAELRGETAQPTGDAPEIRVGDLIEIRQPGRRKWAMRVKYANHAPGQPSAITGNQVRMVDGATTRTRSVFLKSGEYIIVERAKPCTECHMTGPHKLDCSKRRTVAAEQPRKTVTAKVDANRGVQVSLAVAKLTEAQIDTLHIIGAPDKIRSAYFRQVRPHGRSVLALRDRLYVERTALALTEDGRDAYLRCQPTGRLPQVFADAWAGTTVLASEPIRATLDGPACLTDGEADELGTKTAQAIGDLLKPELFTLDELKNEISMYGTAVAMNNVERAIERLQRIHLVLGVLYREAGR